MTLITIRRRTPRRPSAAATPHRTVWPAALLAVLAGASTAGAQFVWLRAGGGLSPLIALGAVLVPGPLAFVPIVSLARQWCCSWHCGSPG